MLGRSIRGPDTTTRPFALRRLARRLTWYRYAHWCWPVAALALAVALIPIARRPVDQVAAGTPPRGITRPAVLRSDAGVARPAVGRTAAMPARRPVHWPPAGAGDRTDSLITVTLPDESPRAPWPLVGLALASCLALLLAVWRHPPFGHRPPPALTEWPTALPTGGLSHGSAAPLSSAAAEALAHHLNNALSVVISNANLLGELAPNAAESVRDIQQAAHRSARLVRRLQYAARREPLARPTRVDLAAALALAIEQVSGRLDQRREIAAEGLESLAAAGLVEDVTALFAEVLENSFEATAADGRIDIQAMHLGRWVGLLISDDGSGMDAATLRCAGQPFYTTRGPCHTGIGLSVIDGIVTRCRGRWRITSTLGGGCQVEVELPAWSGDE